MTAGPQKRKVEFIESYWTGGEYGSDYVWNDNHGELIRCKECKHWSKEQDHNCMIKQGWFPTKPDWYCADGERKENKMKTIEIYWNDLTEEKKAEIREELNL